MIHVKIKFSAISFNITTALYQLPAKKCMAHLAHFSQTTMWSTWNCECETSRTENFTAMLAM